MFVYMYFENRFQNGHLAVFTNIFFEVWHDHCGQMNSNTVIILIQPISRSETRRTNGTKYAFSRYPLIAHTKIRATLLFLYWLLPEVLTVFNLIVK